MRKTSICGLGQVALGPVASVLGLQRGGAAARPQPGLTVPGPPRAGREFFTTGRSPRRWPASDRRRPRSRRCLSTRRWAGRRRAGSRHRTPCPGSPGPRSTDSRSARPTRSGPRRGCPATSTSSGRWRWAARRRSTVHAGGAVADTHRGGAAGRRRRGRHGRAHPGDDARHDRGDQAGRTRRRDGARRRGRRRRRRARARRPSAPRAGPRACSPPPASPPSTSTPPAGGVVSTGDEVVPPATRELEPGQVRDATASALAALVREAGGEPSCSASCPTTAAALEPALRDALRRRDLVVVSAGSSVGARDETAGVVPRSARPDLVPRPGDRPGKPTLLADCDGVPVIGLPGNPLSALVVFRLVGVPLVAGRRHHRAAAGAGVRGRLDAQCRPRPAGSTSFRCGCATAARSPSRCSGRRPALDATAADG